MSPDCRLTIPQALFDALDAHLFPGDGDEHAAVMLAGVATIEGQTHLLAREVYLAEEGVDHVPGQYGYKMMRAEFIRPLIRRARIERLAYIGIHNHGGSNRVEFSSDDFASHERGHPALLDLAEGMPVAAAVFARNAAAGSVWMPDGRRLRVTETRVIGSNVSRLYPQARFPVPSRTAGFDRQVLMFGSAGQALLEKATVGVIGAGGVGSLLVEYLARLGIGRLIIVDPDVIDTSNLSRVAGAVAEDVEPPQSWLRRLLRRPRQPARRKIEIADRVARQANPSVHVTGIDGDFAHDDVARQLLGCDFMFLAADSMRARLVFNAMAHQYYIPGIQIGSLVTPTEDGKHLESVFSVTRWLTPGRGCLWCSESIDRHLLALEAKSDQERKEQDYGSGVPNPSVITLNAVGAAGAANDFLFSYLGMFERSVEPAPRRFLHLDRRIVNQQLRPVPECTECGATSNSRFGRGDGVNLPTTKRPVVGGR